MQGEVGETVELGERLKEEEWWKGSHCACASREVLVRWIKQNLNWVDRKGGEILFCRTQGSAGCNALLLSFYS